MIPLAFTSWNPSHIPGCVVRMDMQSARNDADLTKPATFGQTVINWMNKGTDSIYLRQANGNQQPIVGHLNGVDDSNGEALIFDGENDWMVNPTDTGFLSSRPGAEIIIVARKISDAGSDHFMVVARHRSAGDASFGIFCPSSSTIRAGGRRLATDSFQSTGFVGFDDDIHVIRASVSWEDRVLEHWMDNTLVGSHTSFQTSGLSDPQDRWFCIGGGTPPRFQNIAISHLLVYNRKLTSPEWGRVYSHLQRKHHL